jgi:hypothetical protein
LAWKSAWIEMKGVGVLGAREADALLQRNMAVGVPGEGHAVAAAALECVAQLQRDIQHHVPFADARGADCRDVQLADLLSS